MNFTTHIHTHTPPQEVTAAAGTGTEGDWTHVQRCQVVPGCDCGGSTCHIHDRPRAKCKRRYARAAKSNKVGPRGFTCLPRLERGRSYREPPRSEAARAHGALAIMGTRETVASVVERGYENRLGRREGTVEDDHGHHMMAVPIWMLVDKNPAGCHSETDWQDMPWKRTALDDYAEAEWCNEMPFGARGESRWGTQLPQQTHQPLVLLHHVRLALESFRADDPDSLTKENGLHVLVYAWRENVLDEDGERIPGSQYFAVELPGGQRQGNETSLIAALEETWEETSVDVVVDVEGGEAVVGDFAWWGGAGGAPLFRHRAFEEKATAKKKGPGMSVHRLLSGDGAGPAEAGEVQPRMGGGGEEKEDGGG